MTLRRIRHHHFHSCMSFLTTKEEMTFRCIRHYHVLSCVFFLTTKEEMRFRCIRHHHFLSCMSFLTTKEEMTFRCICHYHVLSCVSFLTTKEEMRFRCIRYHDIDLSECFWEKIWFCHSCWAQESKICIISEILLHESYFIPSCSYTLILIEFKKCDFASEKISFSAACRSWSLWLFCPGFGNVIPPFNSIC